MKRPSLHAVAPPKRPSYSLIRHAARQFKGSYAQRKERHALIRKWLVAKAAIGDKWLLATPVQRKEAA